MREQAFQWALTQNRTLGMAAPERGHLGPLEPLAQLADAQGGVGTLDNGRGVRVSIFMDILVEAAEPVATQAAKGRRGVSMGR